MGMWDLYARARAMASGAGGEYPGAEELAGADRKSVV